MFLHKERANTKLDLHKFPEVKTKEEKEVTGSFYIYMKAFTPADTVFTKSFYFLFFCQDRVYKVYLRSFITYTSLTYYSSLMSQAE